MSLTNLYIITFPGEMWMGSAVVQADSEQDAIALLREGIGNSAALEHLRDTPDNTFNVEEIDREQPFCSVLCHGTY